MTNQTTLATPTIDSPIPFSTASLIGIVASLGLMLALFQFEADARSSYGFYSVYSSLVLAMIYFWKFIILQSNYSRFQKKNSFILLLVLILPFVYWGCFATPTIEKFSFGHLIGNPFWILPVPVASFLLFEMTGGKQAPEHHVARWFCETVIIFPAWTAFCAWALIKTGLATDWVDMFWGC